MVNVYVDALTETRDAGLRPGQVRTHEQGIAYKATRWDRLARFLILGVPSGPFYASAKELTIENVGIVKECLSDDPTVTIDMIRHISQAGRAPSNDPALLALAVALRHPDLFARQYAAKALPEVARTGTHLLHLANFVTLLGKEGDRNRKLSSRVLRRAFASWFLGKTPEQLAYQAVKYPSRDGWSMADVLRLCRAKPPTKEHDLVFKWIVSGDFQGKEGLIPFLLARDQMHESPGLPENLTNIRHYRLPREAIPTELLNKPEVWEALLDDMPLEAMIRNLGKMTNVGLLALRSNAEKLVISRLTDADYLRKSRIHPMKLLIAGLTYGQGHGEKGSLKWGVLPDVHQALDHAFYAAFPNVVPTGKRIRLCIDVSSSMDTAKVLNGLMSARTAATAMALITHATEPNCSVVAFSHEMLRVEFDKSIKLLELVRKFAAIPMGGGTFTGLPIATAMVDGEALDAFVVYTDNETMDGCGYVDDRNHQWAFAGRAYGTRLSERGLRVANAYKGSTSDILNQYRKETRLPVRFVTASMVANDYTIADPNDPLSLDLVGFDAALPTLISDFVGDRLLS